jgi:hypothetical protein
LDLSEGSQSDAQAGNQAHPLSQHDGDTPSTGASGDDAQMSGASTGSAVGTSGSPSASGATPDISGSASGSVDASMTGSTSGTVMASGSMGASTSMSGASSGNGATTDSGEGEDTEPTVSFANPIQIDVKSLLTANTVLASAPGG